MTGWFKNGPRLMRHVMSAGYVNHAFLEATMEGNIDLQGCRDICFGGGILQSTLPSKFLEEY